MAYAPTETQNTSNRHAFWTSLDKAVEEVPRHEHFFVLMDANARTERRERDMWGARIANISVPTAEMLSTTTESYCCPSLTTMA